VDKRLDDPAVRCVDADIDVLGEHAIVHGLCGASSALFQCIVERLAHEARGLQLGQVAREQSLHELALAEGSGGPAGLSTPGGSEPAAFCARSEGQRFDPNAKHLQRSTVAEANG